MLKHAKWLSPAKSKSPKFAKGTSKSPKNHVSGGGCKEGGRGTSTGVQVVGVREAEFVYLAGLAANNGEGADECDGYENIVPCISDSRQGVMIDEGHNFGTPAKVGKDCGSLERLSELVPRVGMMFECREEIEAFYKRYAKEVGFGVSRAQSAYTTDRKCRRATTWRCEAWGGSDLRQKRERRKREKEMEVGGSNVPEVVTKRKRKSKKCNCPAMLYASVNKSGFWEIRKLILEHQNHNPTPSKSKLVKEYRMEHFTRNVKRKLLNDYEVGVPVGKIHGSMARERSGLDNMEITVKDMQHVVAEVRKTKMSGGDANALVTYFAKMQADNKFFFHTHRLDIEGHLKDVLWIDARSQAAYEDFGDVVCFDCTYLTNEYGLAFGNFVGVNHHGQSLLLGCALLSHEDKDTFHWVFEQWLIGMGGKAPQGILTDQAAAMRGPLEEVMPNTRHRWCIWHILMKLPNKLGLHKSYADLKEDLLSAVYDSFTVEEFELSWIQVIEKYELESHDWLTGLFEEREMWVTAYMKDYFWAGMRTTQRVESINSFFDQFVTRNTRLCEFGQKYCAALEKRISQEKDADARSVKWYRPLVTGIPIEKFFHGIYTDAKFRDVQKECERLIYCYAREEKEVGLNEYEYLIEDRVWVARKGGEEFVTSRRRMYNVHYNCETKDVRCCCKMFETHGILCRHTIRVLDQNMVTEVPTKYILRRWRKDVPRKHSRVKVPYHDPTKTIDVRRYDSMMNEFDPISSEASLSAKKTAIVRKGLKKIKAEMDAVAEEEEALPSSTVVNFESETDLGEGLIGLIDMVCTPSTGRSSKSSETPSIKDPPIPKKRGRPKTTRYKSPGEKGWKKANESKAGKRRGGCVKGKEEPVGRGAGSSTKNAKAAAEGLAKKKKGKGKGKILPESSEAGGDQCLTTNETQVNAEACVPGKLQVKRRKRAPGLEETANSLHFMSIASQDEDVLLSQNALQWNQM